jgi:hypothetical protein
MTDIVERLRAFAKEANAELIGLALVLAAVVGLLLLVLMVVLT